MDRKDAVRRFVDEAINDGRDEVVDELFMPDMAARVRDWFGAFRRSFPDMRIELVELVADGETVVGRFACSATHLGDWRGHSPTGRRFEDVDRSISSASRAIASTPFGGSRTRSTGSVSSASSPPTAERHPRDGCPRDR